MRILYLCQRVPFPPNKGDKLRSFNQIKFLSRSHEISLVCLTDNNSDRGHHAALAQYCQSVDIIFQSPLASKINLLKKIFRKKPFTLAYFYSAKVQQIVYQKLSRESFDLVFVFCSSMAQYVEEVTTLPKAIDFVDVDSEKWAQYALHTTFPLRQIYQIENHRLRQYEKRLCQLFQCGFLVSEKEVEDFYNLVEPWPNLLPLLNGVDLEMFQRRARPYEPRRVVFTGAMDYFANIQTVLYFYKEIFPLIRGEIPDVVFYVVGSNPTRELIELGKNDSSVVVTGYVESIQPYVEGAAVFVAPMRIARGVQNKILEAMALGVPVVTNSLGFKGVSATAGVEIVVADAPQDFAQQVVRLISDRGWRETISRMGRKAVEERYNWTNNLDTLNGTLSEAVEKFSKDLFLPASKVLKPHTPNNAEQITKRGAMKILFVCHRFPFPPKRGGKIRPFNIIRHFTSKGHEVTVCSLSRSSNETKEGAGIGDYCKRYVAARVNNVIQALRMVVRLPSSIPSSMGFFYSLELKKRIHKLLAGGHFDLIFVHCSSVAQYVEDVKDIPKLLDFGDMDSQKWLEYSRHKPFPISTGYWIEGAKLEAAEKKLARKFDLCTATTRAEWETLCSYGTAVDSGWFPNGVDTEYFKPDDKDYDQDTISFIGRMDYYPNQECMLDFCHHTLPLIQAVHPNTKLLIIGADPSPAIKKLAELPGVTVTGSVPDVRPYVLTSALMVAPLNIARGTQNKILEAMAMGVPVVSSAKAAGGVDAEDGAHFIICNKPEEYAQACLNLMQNPAERKRLSVSGRQRMLTNHNWAESMQRLDGIVERLLAGYKKDSNVIDSGREE